MAPPTLFTQPTLCTLPHPAGPRMTRHCHGILFSPCLLTTLLPPSTGVFQYALPRLRSTTHTRLPLRAWCDVVAVEAPILPRHDHHPPTSHHLSVSTMASGMTANLR